MKQIINCLFILAAILPCATTQAQNIPDTLLTIDHIYQYTFTDFEKSQQIARIMRQRKMEPSFKLDMAEGDLYFNTGKYHQAVKYYTQAMQSDSVQLDDQRLMKVMHRFISCYDGLQNYSKKAEYIDKLLQKSQAVGDKVMESIASFNMGRMLFYQKDKERGYELVYRGIELMENSDYEYKTDNLIYNYNTLYTMLQIDQNFEEALKVLDKLEMVIADSNTNQVVSMDGIIQKELKNMYAQRALALSKLNRKKEAAEAYAKWKEMGNINDKDNHLIIPYLMTVGHLNEVIRLNQIREANIRQHGDTISYQMRTIKRTSGRVYEAMGDYKMAMKCFDEVYAITDSLKAREQMSAAVELATVYETMEKEAEIQQKNADLKLRNLMLISAVVIILLLIVLLWRYVYYTHTIRKKNLVLVNTINQLMQYKDEKREKDEREQQITDTPVSPGDSNTALFNRLESVVIGRKLYLDRNLTRNDFTKLLGVDKNRFGQILKEEAQTNLTGFLNNLRLEDAVRMLKENPGMSISEISEKCAIPNTSTFYRLFKEKYGMTPVEFRDVTNK